MYDLSVNRAKTVIGKFYQKDALAFYGGLLFLSLGILIRFRNYFSNFSFWCDEAAFAVNILDFNILDLFGPMHMNQVAPIGFCLVVKFMVLLLGNSEMVFRLLPFLGGTTALFLTFVFVCRMVGLWPALLCMAQLCVSNEAIYYTHNFKPYATDLAIALLLMFSAYENRDGNTFWSRFGKTGIMGILAVWFSFPSAFVLGGIGVFWLGAAMRKKSGRQFIFLSVVSMCWLASFSVQYHFLSGQTENPVLLEFWKKYFMPFPPGGWQDLYFFQEVLPGVFKNPLRTWHGTVSGLLFLMGCFFMWRRHMAGLFLILTPLILNLVASGIQKYPFGDRMLLWAFVNLMMPVAVLLIWLSRRKGRWRWMKYAVSALIILNLAKPATHVVKSLMNPEYASGMNHVFAHVLEKKEAKDRFLVHSGARGTFFYYQRRFNFSPNSVRISRIDRPEAVIHASSEMRSLKGRTWLIFDEGKKIGHMDYEKILVQKALEYGVLMDQYVDRGGASAYLFRFPNSS